MRAAIHALIASLGLAACGAPSAPVEPAPPKPQPTVDYAREEGFSGQARVRFVVGGRSLFDTPWPTEMGRRADGRLDIRDFPGRDNFAVASFFEESEQHLLGFSVKPVVYFNFEGEVAPELLAEAVASGAVRLVDVDGSSPGRGRAVPLRQRFFRGARHVPDGTLALRPREVLRPNNLYAAVVLRQLSAGAPKLGTSADFERIKGTTPRRAPRLEAARELHAELFAYLHESGLTRSEIAGVALFRTQQAMAPAAEMVAALDGGVATQPRLLSAEWMESWDLPAYRVIRGYYCTPNFQGGVEHAPFADAGGVIVSSSGKARVVALTDTSGAHASACGGQIRARFVLTIPTGEMPAGGWPLMLYAHGTTGDATSVLGATHFGARAARAGLATVSTDQPLHGSDDPHGARPGSDSSFAFKLGPFPIPLPGKGKGGELAFYNALRPVVMRDNLRQAIADGAALARLMLGIDFATAEGADGTVALGVRVDAVPPKLDATLGYVAAGHSQGSQSMAALGALDPRARAVLLSACGGDFSSAMLLRGDTQKVRRIVELVLGLAGGELNEFHPFATAMQTMLDPVDPQTFGALYREPPEQPRSALLVSGVGDSMTVDEASAALTLAMGLTPLAPMPKPIAGLTPAPVVSANGPRGASTLALLQLAPGHDYEPHFVVFNEVVAATVLESYLRALAKGQGAPRLAISP